jgi:hypothetical protein
VTPTNSFATFMQKLEFLATSVIAARHMCVQRVQSRPAVVLRYLTPRNSDITADFLTSNYILLTAAGVNDTVPGHVARNDPAASHSNSTVLLPVSLYFSF